MTRKAAASRTSAGLAFAATLVLLLGTGCTTSHRPPSHHRTPAPAPSLLKAIILIPCACMSFTQSSHMIRKIISGKLFEVVSMEVELKL